MSHTKLTLVTLLLLSTLASAHHVEGHIGGYSIKEIWAFGIVASFGISMLALIISSIMLVALRTKLSSSKGIKLTVMILTAFAIGALLGDTIVHTIPQIYRARTHDVPEETTVARMLHEGHDHGDTTTEETTATPTDTEETPEEATEAVVEEEEEAEPVPAITSLLILIGFGVFILLEKLFDYMGAPNAQEFQGIQVPDKDVRLQVKYAEVATISRQGSEEGQGIVMTGQKDSKTQVSRQDSVSQNAALQMDSSLMTCRQKVFSLKGRDSIGVVILLSHFVHNIVDGLAIGGTFSTGNEDIAITTFIAVLAHQIPHGIGDMGVLLEAKYPIMQALVWRGLINFSTIIGAAIGLGCGLINESSNAYLLGFVAGNFIYIALVNMLPAVVKESRGWKSIGMFTAFVVGAGFPFALLAVE